MTVIVDLECEYLPWDSELFGHRIGRILSSNLSPSLAEAAREWATRERIACLYFLADPSDHTTLDLARTHRFELTDVRVTLDRSIELSEAGPTDAGCVRAAKPSDVRRLREIASGNHRDTRFYYDAHFSRSRCDELYATWIEKSCRGYADHVLVAELSGEIAGYVTVHAPKGGCASIGLFAVSASVRGSGVATALAGSAIHWLRDHRVHDVRVITQGRNVRALRFYQRAGFLVSELRLWYHWWIDEVGTTQ